MDALLAEDEHALPEAARELWTSTWHRTPWPDTRWGPMRSHLAGHATALRIATLLHDVGKPETRTEEPDGRSRFFGHATVGSRLAVAQLRHWRLPLVLIERVGLLIEQHLRPGQVSASGQLPTARALYRFQEALRDATPDVCFLFLADSLGTVGAEALVPRWPVYISHVQRIACWQPPPAAAQIHRLVDGNSVMAVTGLRPSATVGRVLAAIDEAAAAGEIATPEAALELAVRLIEGEPAAE
jgi:poly(A) polymerase